MVISWHKSSRLGGCGTLCHSWYSLPRRPLLAAIALGKPSQCQAIRAQALPGTWYSLAPPALGKAFRKVHSHRVRHSELQVPSASRRMGGVGKWHTSRMN